MKFGLSVKMQKIIIDTNVIVSSLIQKSYPFHIIFDLFIEDKISLCISSPLMSEYYAVLKRTKFSQFPDFSKKAKYVISNIEMKALYFRPRIVLASFQTKMITKYWSLPMNAQRIS